MTYIYIFTLRKNPNLKGLTLKKWNVSILAFSERESLISKLQSHLKATALLLALRAEPSPPWRVSHPGLAPNVSV